MFVLTFLGLIHLVAVTGLICVSLIAALYMSILTNVDN